MHLFIRRILTILRQVHVKSGILNSRALLKNLQNEMEDELRLREKSVDTDHPGVRKSKVSFSSFDYYKVIQ